MKKQVQGIIDSQTEFLKNINQNIQNYITILHELDELLNDPVKVIKNRNPLLKSQLDNFKEKLK